MAEEKKLTDELLGAVAGGMGDVNASGSFVKGNQSFTDNHHDTYNVGGGLTQGNGNVGGDITGGDKSSSFDTNTNTTLNTSTTVKTGLF